MLEHATEQPFMASPNSQMSARKGGLYGLKYTSSPSRNAASQHYVNLNANTALQCSTNPNASTFITVSQLRLGGETRLGRRFSLDGVALTRRNQSTKSRIYTAAIMQWSPTCGSDNDKQLASTASHNFANGAWLDPGNVMRDQYEAPLHISLNGSHRWSI